MNKFMVCMFLFLSQSVFADDIYTRIDRCETTGGGSCLYSLLRELANNGNGNNGGGPTNTFCECRVSRTSTNGPGGCLTYYNYELYLIRVIAGTERVQQLTTNDWSGGYTDGCNNHDYTQIPQACLQAMQQKPQCQ